MSPPPRASGRARQPPHSLRYSQAPHLPRSAGARNRANCSAPDQRADSLCVRRLPTSCSMYGQAVTPPRWLTRA